MRRGAVCKMMFNNIERHDRLPHLLLSFFQRGKLNIFWLIETISIFFNVLSDNSLLLRRFGILCKPNPI